MNRAYIERNHCIAKMRLRDKKDSSIAQIISDRFWPPEQWPRHVVTSLFTFKYKDRICVCNFFFGNGLQLCDAWSIISFYHDWNRATAKTYEYEFTQLWVRLESAVKHVHIDWHDIVSRYYFYSMMEETVLFFDGTIRLHGKKIYTTHNENIVHVPAQPSDIIVSRCVSRDDRRKQERLERRWQFLASIDGDPIIMDGLVFRFDRKLYTNQID